jgi:sterol 3beta-glucosyltransferase
MIHRAGAGPSPLPHKKMTSESLADAIRCCYTPEAQQAAQVMGERIRSEKGEERGVASFHRHLPLLNMRQVTQHALGVALTHSRCDVDASRAAIWLLPKLYLKMSAAAAGVLVEAGMLSFKDLEPHRVYLIGVRARLIRQEPRNTIRRGRSPTPFLEGPLPCSR